MNKSTTGMVIAVCRNSEPGLPKQVVESIQLIAGFGVEGDYHAGKLVRHRYLVRKDPTRLNNRQVLLTDLSIYEALFAKGINITAGMLAENMVLDRIRVMTLPLGTRIEIGDVLLEVTEVRDPCDQLNEMHPGLRKAVEPKVAGQITPMAGMFASILKSGTVLPGDKVIVIGIAAN